MQRLLHESPIGQGADLLDQKYGNQREKCHAHEMTGRSNGCACIESNGPRYHIGSPPTAPKSPLFFAVGAPTIGLNVVRRKH